MPLLVFGVLAGFNGTKGKAVGRIILGIAFIFLGIDQIKSAFVEFGTHLEVLEQVSRGYLGQLLFVGMGIVLTAMLMSSHATLMLILAALAAGQLELWQGMSLAIGGSVGSSLNVAVMGWLAGDRGGQRLATLHALFNIVTGLTTFSC